jgi:DNA-binding MarR family transcriptional regulator
MRIGDLANALEIVPRTATARVDGLEQAGLATRNADPTDRRSIVVALTEQGQELVVRLTAERRASAETMFAALSPADQAELQRLLGLLATDSC